MLREVQPFDRYRRARATIAAAAHPSHQVGEGVTFSARGLTRSFDHGLVPALRGVDLEIAAGERVAIVGRTGCGKSTLLSLLALLDDPDSGELLIDGRPPRDLGPREAWRGANIGIVFQLHHLLLHLTVEENLALPLIGRARRRDRRRRVGEMVDRMGLGHRAGTLAARLSGGERQLVSVARALVGDPRVVLADEPTGSVDSETGATIMAALFDWARRRHGTLLLVTHDEVLAGSLDRLLQMSDGRLVSSRTTPTPQEERGKAVPAQRLAVEVGIDAARGS